MTPSTKLALTITGLVLLLTLSGLGNCLQRRCRLRLKAIIIARTASVPEVGVAAAEQSEPTYFQRKAELDNEESKLCELAADEERHEIGAYGERYELPANERWNRTSDLQELGGEERSKESEALDCVRSDMSSPEFPVDPI